MTRYRYRGHRIPTPWAATNELPATTRADVATSGPCPVIDQWPTLRRAGCVGTRTSGSEGGGEQTTAHKRGTAARRRPYIERVRRSARNVKR